MSYLKKCLLSLSSLFIFILLLSPHLIAQKSDNIIKQIKLGSTVGEIFVDSLPDSSARHVMVTTLDIEKSQAGYYRIYLKCLYTGKGQLNEHFFITLQKGDSIRTPYDANLGKLKVVRDTLDVPGSVWRDVGLFHFSSGTNTIFLNHYNALFKDLSFGKFIEGIEKSKLLKIVTGDSITAKQSVHLDSLNLVAEPIFYNPDGVIKSDLFDDRNNYGNISPGDLITYTVYIKNSGTGIAHEVFFIDSIPQNTSYVNGSANTSKGQII